MRSFTGSAQAWNRLIASLPKPHLLQSWEWSQVKARFGWQPIPVVWDTTSSPPGTRQMAAAMILKRTLPFGGFAQKMSVLYVPKGPNLDWEDSQHRVIVLDELQHLARKQGAIFIKVDADVELGTGVPGSLEATENRNGQALQSEFIHRGWRFSPDQIQFRNTVLVDLMPAQTELLAGMKQKTRYNVNLALKKGVTVRRGTQQDIPMLYRMYAETSVRDGFLIREEDYYQTVWGIFSPASATPEPAVPFSEPLIAEVESEPVAAISIFYFARQAVYLFGMSRNVHREKMPNYLLQWEAIKRAKELGCLTYNLWGAPDVFTPQDPLWGVYRFKEGLGGFVSRTLGAWDYTPNPMLYRLYTNILPRIMDIMRFRGNVKTRQRLGA